MILRKLFVLAMAVALVAAVAPATAQNLPVQWTIVVSNVGPQPLSPIFFAIGDDTYDIFDAGAAASSAIKGVAEGGDVSGLIADAAAAGAAVADYGVVHPGSPLLPGQSAFIQLISYDTHQWLSFAGMLGMSNDAFIGSALGIGDGQIDLWQGGEPLNAHFTISYLDVWDAGTEDNTESSLDTIGGAGNPADTKAAGAVITSPHPGILGIGDIPVDRDWTGRDVARITIIPTVVPEPASISVLAAGLGGMLLRRRKRA